MSSEQELIDHYRKYFYMVNANTQELQNLAFKIRYQVYIKELDYHPNDNIEGNKEWDKYDKYSLHSLLFHKPTNQPIGCIRLIPHNPGSSISLPIEEYCKNSPNNIAILNQLKAEHTGEISRMALISNYRRRPSDIISVTKNGSLEVHNNRRFSINYLPICLTLAGLNLMFIAELDFAVALMDKRLAVLLRLFGVKHTMIGDPIEHDGIRDLYKIDKQATYDSLNPQFKTLFSIIKDDLTTPHQTLPAKESEAV